MAVHQSVMKRARQNTKARQRNRSWKSRIKTQQKRIENALENKETGALEQMYRDYSSLADKAVSKGVIHKNTAARKKMKMHLRIQGLVSQSKPPASKDKPSKKSTASKAATPSKKAASSKKAPASDKTSAAEESEAPAESEATDQE